MCNVIVLLLLCFSSLMELERTTRLLQLLVLVSLQHTVCGCQGGWVNFGTACYRLVNLAPNSATWWEARDGCRMYGGDLVSIHSEEENDWLFDTFSPNVDGNYAVIGLSNISATGWTWSDGTPFDFSIWSRTTDEYDDCVRSPYGNGFRKWRMYPCNEKGSDYLCKMQGMSVFTLYTVAPVTAVIHGDYAMATHTITDAGGQDFARGRCASLCQGSIGCSGFNFYTSTFTCEILNLSVKDSSSPNTRVDGGGDAVHYYLND